MNVLFGLYLDRAPWTYRESALGAVRVGPLGLAQLLQTRLGLTGPETRHSTRIRQFMARLAEQDNPEAWFHGSFSVDPWSTAIDLLNLRDELVLNGWSGLTTDGSTAKLRALASIEQSTLPLDRAFADYPLELIRELESEATAHWPLGLSQLKLQHPRASFPAIWDRLIGALERRGVMVVEPPVPTGPVGEVTVLVARTEWEAAEHTARWLASADNPASARSAVVASTSTALLDQELKLRGLPRIGVGARSRWRAIDQIIPLFFNVIWRPADVQLLGEFLNLPVGPARRAAARAFGHAPRDAQSGFLDFDTGCADQAHSGRPGEEGQQVGCNLQLADGDLVLPADANSSRDYARRRQEAQLELVDGDRLAELLGHHSRELRNEGPQGDEKRNDDSDRGQNHDAHQPPTQPPPHRPLR